LMAESFSALFFGRGDEGVIARGIHWLRVVSVPSSSGGVMKAM